MYMKNQLLFSIIVISLVSVSFTSISAQTNTIPDWVKSNAEWWADGQIGDTEFIKAMQYLINQGLIVIPVTYVASAVVSDLTENDRAMSIVVHYNGEIFGQDGETIYTYSEFQHLSSTVKTNTGIQTVIPTVPTFYLAGLPSIDKKIVYNLVDEFVNPGRPPAQYDVQVEILTGDGKGIQTWDYRKCSIIDYVTYLDSSKLDYRFADLDESEIREVLVWECAGFSLLTP